MSTTKSQNKKPASAETQSIEHEIFVDDEGRLCFLYDDELADLIECGDPDRRRASHVEPFGVSEWTADMGPVGGPILGPFPTRSQALLQEKSWLNNFLGQ